MAIELVYETHAITTDNEAGIATGWLPGVLSAAGRRIGRASWACAGATTGSPRSTSRTSRGRVETARIAFDGSAVPIVEDARLRECNYGELNGMPRDAPGPRARPRTSTSRGRTARATATSWRGRATFLEDLRRQWDGARILVIAHSANQWALEHLLLGADLATRVRGRA